ncbi:MAG: hemolysin family protein [Pseudomonadota bacterium]
MGDSIDDSSRAAQSAQSIQKDPEPQGDTTQTETQRNGHKSGFLRRMIDSLTPASFDGGEAGEDGEETAADAAHGLGNLRALSVEDVAIPKTDIVSVPININKDGLVKVFRDSGLTRLPVYDGTIDSPVGFIHLKDFALKHGFNGGGGRFSLKKMLRPLMFVPPSMPIGVLLQKFQAERSHMALVIDEYGGVDGLVTIEDLIEQVVGEIADEHDVDEGRFWSEERPGCFVAQAKTPLDEFELALGVSLTDVENVDEEEIDTLGGLIFMLLGRVPARGEMVEHPSGIEIQVLDSDPRRIKRLRVRVPDATEAALT